MLIDIPSYVTPTITLSNISYEDLEAIIGYIYTGELPFSTEKLQSVLETAACFEIESLMQVTSVFGWLLYSVVGVVNIKRRLKRYSTLLNTIYLCWLLIVLI